MNISTLTRAVIAASLLLAVVQVGRAQAPSANPPAGGGAAAAGASAAPDCVGITNAKATCDLNSTFTDIAAPDSPAFTVLGLTPSNITKPNSPSALATAVLNAFDDNGHFQSGTAIDVVPFLVFKAKSFTLGKYADHGAKAYLTRVASRTSVSFATAKGTSTPDTSVRMATGIRISLLDFGDQRAVLGRCVGLINSPVDPNNPGAPISDKLKKQIADCRTTAQKKLWNATSVVVAAAPAWISTDGSTSNLKRNGQAFWASAAYGFGTWGQLILDGRRQTGQQIVPPTSPSSSSTSAAGTGSSSATAGTGGGSASNQFVLQDTTVLGGAFKFGQSDFNGTVAGLYIGKRTAGVPDSYPEFSFALEKKLATNVYLELSYRYDATQKNVSGVLTNLKWNFSQQAKDTAKKSN